MNAAHKKSSCPIFLLTLCLVAWTLAPAAAQVERGPVQPRPGISPVVGDDSPDMQPVIPGARAPKSAGRTGDADYLALRGEPAGMDEGIAAEVQVGGDDVLMFTDADGTYSGTTSTAFDSDGNGYFARGVITPTDDWVEVRRSTDGGLTWPVWGSIPATGMHGGTKGVDVLIAEGAQDRCFVAFHQYSGAYDYYIVVMYAELSASSAVFTQVAAIELPGEDILYPSLATDNANYDEYFLYLTARSEGADHDKIWFTRSTNQGATWETEYPIAELIAIDRDYYRPRVTYGFNAKIHVAWYFKDWSGTLDEAIRYKSAENFAGGGTGSWGPIQYLTSNSDGMDESLPKIAASLNGDEVMIAYESGPIDVYPNIEVMDSADQGATWSAPTVTDAWPFGFGLKWQPSTDSWILGYRGYGMTFQRASTSAPTVWSDAQYFWDGPVDGAAGSGFVPFALNPAMGDRVGAFWSHSLDSGGYIKLFDAEWFNDPGWPVEEPDSPVALTFAPTTAPAIVDLDGNGDLEIVFSDDGNRVVALHHDGTEVSGWPVVPGPVLSGSPVAVGDLNGDDSPEIAVGAVGGQVFLYDSAGDLVDGWPVSTISPSEAHVSIGALGPPYHRVVVVCAGLQAEAFNYSGRVPPGYVFHETPETLVHPAAIGDVDGDGSNDIVIAGTSFVGAYHPAASSPSLVRILVDVVSDAPTLGDLDLDGDVEVLVPTTDGLMYALDDDGSDMAGWPYDTGSSADLSSAALANCLGTGEPEVAFSAENYTVHLVWFDGVTAIGYPVNTGAGWFIKSDPVIGLVEGTSGDILIGARDKKIWSWDNFGQLLGGWPRAASGYVHQTAAMGDLDLDGNNEVVILDESQMMIFDVNNPVGTSNRTWAMQGHDSRRSGCWECPEDLVSAVEDPTSPAQTRVSFAMKSTNPASGRAQFSLSLPERAAVSVDVFDVRGRRVRTVLRAEIPTGTHLVSWDGRDGEGRAVSSGQYLMRLTAKGPRIDEHMVRKVTWLR